MIYAATLITDESERDFFLEIYEEYKNLMFHIAYKVLKDIGLSEDCVQEASITIAKNISKLDSVHSVRTRRYIITIVKNKAIDLYRAHHKIVLNEVYLDELTLCDNSVQEFEITNNGDLYISILRLSLIYRDVILLKYAAGYSNKEIASILSISTDVVRQRLARAKKKLSEDIVTY